MRFCWAHSEAAGVLVRVAANHGTRTPQDRTGAKLDKSGAIFDLYLIIFRPGAKNESKVITNDAKSGERSGRRHRKSSIRRVPGCMRYIPECSCTLRSALQF